MCNIIITGGNGFIGLHLIKKLVKLNFNVFNIDIKNKRKPLDITDFEEMRKIFKTIRPDVVIHLAAIASVPYCEKNIEKAYRVNVMGTLNIAKLAEKYGAKIIFASSSAVYGIPKVIPTPESYPPSPINHYGITKLAGELIVKKHCGQYIIFRIFNVYGPECQRSYVIPDIIRKILKGGNKVFLSGTGEEKRDFIYIDDAIDAFLMVVRNDISGTFNLGTGTPTKIKDLAKIIAKLMGIKNVTFIFEGRTREGDFPVNQADITRIRKVLGWTPRFSLERGLKFTIDYYVQRTKNYNNHNLRYDLTRNSRTKTCN